MNRRIVAGGGCLAVAAFVLYTSLGMFVPWSIWQGATSDVAALITTPFLALVGGTLIASGYAPRQRSSVHAFAVALGGPLVSRRVVAASEASECSALTCGEAEHKRPHEDRNLKLAVPFDHAEFFGVLFEKYRWKERSEPTHNLR